jgi:excisionase family DNA binding protein
MTRPITWAPDAQAALSRIRGKLFATTTEASLVLGYDRQGRTIRAGIESGEVPAVRVGNTYRIPAAWLLQQVRLGTSGGDDAAA